MSDRESKNTITPATLRAMVDDILSGKCPLTAEPRQRPDDRQAMQGTYLFYSGPWHLWFNIYIDEWGLDFAIGPDFTWVVPDGFQELHGTFPLDDIPDDERDRLLSMMRECEDEPMRYVVEQKDDTITVNHGPGYGRTVIREDPTGMILVVTLDGVPESCRDTVYRWICASINAAFPKKLAFDA